MAIAAFGSIVVDVRAKSSGISKCCRLQFAPELKAVIAALLQALLTRDNFRDAYDA
jgi:hypothetical protein